MRLANTYGIKVIQIEAEAKCFCPLGKDWYTNHFLIEMNPAEFIPDYCDIDNFIKEKINGAHLIIEAAVDFLYAYIKNEYAPEYLKITSYVDDATHSTVNVVKE